MFLKYIEEGERKGFDKRPTCASRGERWYEILGLTGEEQLEVYRAVVDLVKSRIEKAKSFGKKTNTKEGIDIDTLKNAIIERIKREL